MAVVPRQVNDASPFIYTERRRYRIASNSQEAISDNLDLPLEMRMTQRDFKLFLVALDEEEEPNQKLKDLFHNGG